MTCRKAESEKGFAFQTISNFKRSLKVAFYTAIEDDCIRKNPFNFALDIVIEDDRERKAALTPKQEESLLAFMEQDAVYKKYRDEVIILLGTGLRITHLLYSVSQCRHEPQGVAVYHGTRQYNNDFELLRPCSLRFRKG